MTTNDDPPARRALFVAFEGMVVLDLTGPLTVFWSASTFGSRLTGRPIGRLVEAEAMKFRGCWRLNAEYAKQFGVETPDWKGKH